MSSDKIKIVSLSLDPEMHNLIKQSAERLGHKNVSQLIRDLIKRYLNLLVNDSDETPIVIRIPNELRKNKEELRSWLEIKTKAIVDAISVCK